jgi:hypothetical protein
MRKRLCTSQERICVSLIGIVVAVAGVITWYMDPDNTISFGHAMGIFLIVGMPGDYIVVWYFEVDNGTEKPKDLCLLLLISACRLALFFSFINSNFATHPVGVAVFGYGVYTAVPEIIAGVVGLIIMAACVVAGGVKYFVIQLFYIPSKWISDHINRDIDAITPIGAAPTSTGIPEVAEECLMHRLSSSSSRDPDHPLCKPPLVYIPQLEV